MTKSDDLSATQSDKMIGRSSRRRHCVEFPLAMLLLPMLLLLHFLSSLHCTAAWRNNHPFGDLQTFETGQDFSSPMTSSSSSSTLFFDDSLATSAAMVLEATRYEELGPTLFGPDGRLFSVEAAYKASQLVVPCSNIVLAMKCKDGLVLLTTIPTSAFLNTTTVMTVGNGTQKQVTDTTKKSLFLLDETCQSTTTAPTVVTPNLVAATGGNAIHGKILRQHIRDLLVSRMNDGADVLDATTTSSEGNTFIRARNICQDVADTFQEATQTMLVEHFPLLGCSALLLGQEEIWRVDTTGQFWQCQVTCIGQDAQKVEERLYEMVVEDMAKEKSGSQPFEPPSSVDVQDYLNNLTCEEALELLKKCLTAHLHERYRKERRNFPWSTSKSDGASPKEITVPQIFWQSVAMKYGDAKNKTRQRFQMAPTIVVRQDSFELMPDEVEIVGQ